MLDTTWRASASGTVSANLAVAPVDVEKMARDLGLRVIFSDSIPDGISGKIYPSRDAEAGFCVEINAREAKTRQRFTLAHEIAHFVLHRDLIGDGVTDSVMYRSNLRNENEAEANRYAAEILLPRPLVRREYLVDKAIAPLAQKFHVSPEAMKIRLKQLGFAP